MQEMIPFTYEGTPEGVHTVDTLGGVRRWTSEHR